MHFGQQDLKDLFIDEVAIKRKLSFQNDNPRKKVSYPLFNFQQKYSGWINYERVSKNKWRFGCLLRLYGTIRYFVIFLIFIFRDQNQIRTL